MRAMHLIANLDRGGGQEVVRTLARHLPAAGVEPVVVTLRDGELRSAIESFGVPVHVVAGRQRSILSGPQAAVELKRIRRDILRIARSERTTVLQTHLLRSLDFLTLTMRDDAGIRQLYWTVHNAMLDLRRDQAPGPAWTVGPKRVAHRWLYRAGARRIDGLIAVSSDVGEAVRRAYRPPADRLAVIPNGVDTDRYGRHADRGAIRQRIGVDGSAPLAIVVAKLMPQKGHAVLVEALPPVLARHPDLQVLLVGEGELRDSIAARVRAAGIETRVHFLGNRPDVPELLASSDLFVLPSLWEGLPMALLEAMASRIPVVATSVAGTREVVEDGVSGVLVPPGDARSLALAMEALLGDRGHAARLAEGGRRRVESCYSARAQAELHADRYLADARRRSRRGR
jgi:glycosyltransferase involved in cell wall biosynthesis